MRSPYAIDFLSKINGVGFICEAYDADEITSKITSLCQGFDNFSIRRRESELREVVASFNFAGYEFEIFGAPVPVNRNNAYRHLNITRRLIQILGEDFRKEVLRLKLSGVKTEPAIARLLGLSNDPYQSLLQVERWDDQEILKCVSGQEWF